MNFRQILLKHNPIDSKNKLNKLLAEVERNFGVFSRDMELDIRTSISSSVVLDYFDRIIHEEHPQLEHDDEKKKEKKEKAKVETNKKECVTNDSDTNNTPPKKKKKKQINKLKKILSIEEAIASTKKKTEQSHDSMKFTTYNMVDTVVKFFKKNTMDLNAATESWVRHHILGHELSEYYKDRMRREIVGYNSVVYHMLNMSSTINKERRGRRIEQFRNKLSSFISSERKQGSLTHKSVEKTKSSFDVLTKKEWKLDWNCVMFKRGTVVIYSRSDLGFKFSPTTVYVRESLESFNYLKKYLNERLPPVRCSIVGLKLTVIDKINFNSAIQQFSAAARQGAIKTGGRSSNKGGAPMTMSFSQAMSKAKQLSPEEFKKWKSKYIDFLVTQQSKDYKVIPCVERLVHTIGDTTEYAFMFSIECKSGDILIVHENVNPDRSTLLFIVKRANYDKCIRAIYDFLQSAEINKRSSLRDRDLDIGQVGIERYRSINHDFLSSWKKNITNYKLHYQNGYVFIY